MSHSNEIPSKEVRTLLKKIAPDLERLLDLTENDEDDESVIDECIRSGARSLLIANRIIRDNRK